jgi:hypothetical protein
MLDPIVSDINSLPEALRKEYKEIAEGKHKGKWMLDVKMSEGFALEDVAGLKSSLENARAERDAERAKFKAIGNHKPEEIAEAVSRLEEIKSWNPDKKAEEAVKSREKQLNDKFSQEQKALQDQLKARENEINELLVTSEATRAITEQGGNVQLLLPHVVSKIQVRRDGSGKPKAVVLNDDGNPRISMKQGANGDMGILEYVESFKTNPTYAPAFKASGASGGAGSQRKNEGGMPSSATNTDGMSAVDKLKMLREQQQVS